MNTNHINQQVTKDRFEKILDLLALEIEVELPA